MTLVLGGIRSGKSQYAEQIAAGFGKKILYVATAEVWPGAGSMEYRVRKHRERRPASWLTLECPRHVAAAVRESGLLDQVDGVILECVTLLTSNTLYAQKDPTDYEPFQEALIEEIEALKELIPQSPVPWVLVSSETGHGISQADAETRHYCDGLGIANQLLAKSADEVYFMVAGLPVTVKNSRRVNSSAQYTSTLPDTSAPVKVQSAQSQKNKGYGHSPYPEASPWKTEPVPCPHKPGHARHIQKRRREPNGRRKRRFPENTASSRRRRMPATARPCTRITQTPERCCTFPI